MKKYLLLDHDGVLVDTELWYYRAGERALADIGTRAQDFSQARHRIDTLVELLDIIL
ncbi:hypothetical protein [Longispora urticae]